MTVPVLYIIMRNDLGSLNSGKAIAQGAHAANAFVDHFHQLQQRNATTPTDDCAQSLNHSGFYQWERQTAQGFGTVIVLEGDINQINQTIDLSKKSGYIAGIVHDPTYPIVDGPTVHYIPLDTCSYVFVPDKSSDTTATSLLSHYPLHK